MTGVQTCALPICLIHVTTADISLVLLLGPQLRAFRDAGYEVIGASAPGPFVAELESWGIEHRALDHATRAMAPHRDAAALAELYRLFRGLRPAIVHTHNPKPGVYGRLAARAARVPAIVNTPSAKRMSSSAASSRWAAICRSNNRGSSSSDAMPRHLRRNVFPSYR